MSIDRETEAARLRDIEVRLNELAMLERAGGAAAPEQLAGRLAEVNALFEESKALARDSHTSVFARIAVQAGFLIGRLELALRRSRQEPLA
jgi:hypothetical protein